RRIKSVWRSLRLRQLAQRHPNMECRSFSHLRLEPYLPSMESDDGCVSQGQSLSRSLPHRLGREEGLKYPREYRLRYSRASIGNRDLDPLSISRGRDHNLSFFLRILLFDLRHRVGRVNQ